MYSTLRFQKNLTDGNHHVTRKLFLKKFMSTRTKHIMLVRNPYDRVASFYADKFKKHPSHFKEGNARGWQDCQKLLF